MIGFLDGISDGEVYGWCMDPANVHRPVTVTILVNDRPVADTSAIYHRNDVGNAYDSKGYHGFVVDLRFYCDPGATVSVEARASDGTILKNSPQLANIPAEPLPHKPTLLFMHIPKTAGTSFSEAATPHYRLSERMYFYPHDTFVPGGLSPWLLPLEHRKRLRFVVGHFPFGLHRALPQPAEYIALIRDPFDRLISNYFHCLYHSPDMISEGANLLTLCDTLERPPSPSFDNLMVRYFAGTSDDAYPVGSIDASAFEMALTNINRHFVYVGNQSDVLGMYKALRHRYGWKLIDTVPIVNVGRVHITDTERKMAAAAVQTFQKWDILLYNEMARRWAETPYPFQYS